VGARRAAEAMQFGIFYEHQLPRPWQEEDERRGFQQALEQVELADNLGIDFVWEVEHHFLEEYSHSSAPEVFLAACSQRTRRIRLGHGVVLMPPFYNHPVRVAERIATLDLISNGRVEWGTGESNSRMELEGFNINHAEKREMWFEAVRETAQMLCSNPYPGFTGKYFSMPSRNVVPKPVQKPHPPLWVACSNRDTIRMAASLGIGALTFAFADPSEARYWVEEYYSTFKSRCEPIGQAVNPNIAVVTGFMCHDDSEVALERGLEGFQFFSYALNHYYLSGIHVPGRFSIWDEFKHHGTRRSPSPMGAIGSPDQVRAHLEKFEEIGVDQVIFIHQSGKNRHEHVCESLELFAARILPEFQERHEVRVRRKAEVLAPYIEKAMHHLPRRPVPDSVPSVAAYPVRLSTENRPVATPRLPPPDSTGRARGGTGQVMGYFGPTGKESYPPLETRSVPMGDSPLYLWRAYGSQQAKPVLLVQGLFLTDYLLQAADPPMPGQMGDQNHELIEALRRGRCDVWGLVIADPLAPLSAQSLAVSDTVRVVSEASNGGKLDVVGLGIGGLAARYALARDEEIGGPSSGKVGVFATVDTPHQGINIPVGLQAALWVAGGNRADRIMLAPSVQSVLFQWVGSTNFTQNRYRFPLDSSIISTAAAHDAFYSELGALNGDGYPHRTRNIAVASTTPNGRLNRAGDVIYRLKAMVKTAAGSVELCKEDYRARSEDVVPGSALPSTLMPRSLQLGALSLILDCQFDPTCVPLASALDLTGSESPFAATFVGQEPVRTEGVLPKGAALFLTDELTGGAW
jgi:alkanesulfonate monooxygenase SsuD/methylene tetrahydromethanopterin reductase-like flavin-dependent oxidoreductase (luciferase family)